MAEYVELYVDQGEDFTATIVLEDDDTNIYQNITGYSVTGSLRKSLLSQNASANLTCSVTDAANGEITLGMTSSVTSNLKFGTYLFDVKTVVNGSTKRLIEGIITVTPAITK